MLFKKCYWEIIQFKLQKDFFFINIYEVFKVVKVIVNWGFGEVVVNVKFFEVLVNELVQIIGQKVVVICVKKVIVGFKIWQGMLIGCVVIFCGDWMYVFFECLINLVLFCICDFCGVSFKSFDGCGNYIFGVCEQIIFFEIFFDKIDVIWGMDIIIVIIVCLDEEGWVFFCEMGMLFQSN